MLYCEQHGKTVIRKSVKRKERDADVKITKRSGNIVIYDDEKVVNSIMKANKGTGEPLSVKAAEYLADAVLGRLVKNNTFVTTEMISDAVYDALIERDLWLTAREYKGFRKEARSL